MKKLPSRKKIRLHGYDYSQQGAYFITICVKDHKNLLGKIFDNTIVLSEYGQIAKNEIEHIPHIRKECTVDNYVIMPNHIHLIVRIVHVGDDGNRPANTTERADCHPPLRRTLSNMVQGFKGAVTRQIGIPIWQRSYHDRIIRTEESYNRISYYIDENPAIWQEDCYYKI